MGIDDFLRLSQVAISTAAYVAAPILLIGLVAGLAVSIFQAATQINDSAIAFIPKIGATLFGILIFGHFMINRIASFTEWTITQIPNISP